MLVISQLKHTPLQYIRPESMTFMDLMNLLNFMNLFRNQWTLISPITMERGTESAMQMEQETSEQQRQGMFVQCSPIFFSYLDKNNF